MEHVVALSGIAVTLLFVAMSPGPAFLVVVQQAMGRSRGAGLVTALGVSVGSVVWVVLILMGIAVILEQAAWLYTGLRLAGGAYLVYLGIRMFRGATAPVATARSADAGPVSLGHTFWRALLIQLLNPKAAVFFGSVFLTMLAPGMPGWVAVAALVIVFVIEFGWYAVVATALSSQPVRRAYNRSKMWVERIAGAWLALFGVKLALSTR